MTICTGYCNRRLPFTIKLCSCCPAGRPAGTLARRFLEDISMSSGIASRRIGRYWDQRKSTPLTLLRRFSLFICSGSISGGDKSCVTWSVTQMSHRGTRCPTALGRPAGRTPPASFHSNGQPSVAIMMAAWIPLSGATIRSFLGGQ